MDFYFAHSTTSFIYYLLFFLNLDLTAVNVTLHFLFTENNLRLLFGISWWYYNQWHLYYSFNKLQPTFPQIFLLKNLVIKTIFMALKLKSSVKYFLLTQQIFLRPALQKLIPFLSLWVYNCMLSTFGVDLSPYPTLYVLDAAIFLDPNLKSWRSHKQWIGARSSTKVSIEVWKKLQLN